MDESGLRAGSPAIQSSPINNSKNRVYRSLLALPRGDSSAGGSARPTGGLVEGLDRREDCLAHRGVLSGNLTIVPKPKSVGRARHSPLFQPMSFSAPGRAPSLREESGLEANP